MICLSELVSVSAVQSHLQSALRAERLVLLTPELFYPLGGLVEEIFCLLLHVHGLLVDAVQTSRASQSVDLLLQLAVPLLGVIEALGGKKKKLHVDLTLYTSAGEDRQHAHPLQRGR